MSEIIHTNQCRSCKSAESLVKHVRYTRKDGTIVQQYTCNPCNTKRIAEYRQTDRGKASTRKAVYKYEANNRVRRSAWAKAQKTHREVLPCAVCRETQGIDRHHPNVDKPYDVVFLCRLHHKMAHKIESAVQIKAHAV